LKIKQLTKYHCGLLNFHAIRCNHSHYSVLLETHDSVEFFNHKTGEIFTCNKDQYDKWRNIQKGIRI